MQMLISSYTLKTQKIKKNWIKIIVTPLFYLSSIIISELMYYLQIFQLLSPPHYWFALHLSHQQYTAGPSLQLLQLQRINKKEKHSNIKPLILMQESKEIGTLFSEK